MSKNFTILALFLAYYMVSVILIGYQLFSEKLDRKNSMFTKTFGLFSKELDFKGKKSTTRRCVLLQPLMSCAQDIVIVWIAFSDMSFQTKFVIYLIITQVFLIYIIII